MPMSEQNHVWPDNVSGACPIVISSPERWSLLHPNTAQGSFLPLESYSKNTLWKNIPKSARKYKRNVLMPPGHPIILLKLNEFNMAAIVVKRSIAYQQMKDVINIHQTNVKILNRSVFKTCQSRAWYLIQLAEINTKANLSVII